MAGVAIGIAGALFSGGETAARDPAAPETAASPSGAAPAAIPSPDDTPDAGSVVEEDSAAERDAPSPPGVDSDDASAGDAALPTTADDTAAQTAADDTSTASTATTTPAAPGAEGSAAVEIPGGGSPDESTLGAGTTDPPPAAATDASAGAAPVADADDGAGTPEAAAPADTASATNAAVDEPAASDAAAELIGRLRPLVAERDARIPDYDRDHFAGWLDADGDCVNTRHEILQAEAADFSMNAAGCAVDSGEWFDPYTNRTFTDPRDLDVDHVVALADAWVSGAWEWADELLDRFSNDLGNLNAIAAGENRSKSARGPAEYSPTAPAARCDYLVQYATVKIRWGLSITPQDFEVVVTSLTGCDMGIVPDASPTAVDTPSAATEITTSTTQPASDCHPAYEPCLPNLPGDALNCGDLRGDQKPVTVIRPGTDPYRLDRDGDGRGCTS